jgi:hypothetical protein
MASRRTSRAAVDRSSSGRTGLAPHDLVTVDGDHRVSASADATVSAGESIVLRCGESCIRLLPDRILIESPSVEIAGKKEVVAAQGRNREAGWKLDGSFGIKAKKVSLGSAGGASLLLDTNANLDGALVLLNCGGSAAATFANPPQNDARASAIVKIEGVPIGTQLLAVFAAPDGKRIEKKWIAGQPLALEGPAGAAYALIEVRAGDQIIPIRRIDK